MGGSSSADGESGSNPARRAYSSRYRQEQARRTRARVRAAAAAQFLALGYAGATMRAIATEAGVAVATVELAFGTKARLLKAVIDTATAGDEEQIPMLERVWARRAEATPDPSGFVAGFAEVLTDSALRAASLILLVFEAARIDEEIAGIATQMRAQRHVMATWLVEGLMRRSSLRDEVDRSAAIDIVWTLMDPAVFTALTRERGWEANRYETWFTDSVLRLLLPG